LRDATDGQRGWRATHGGALAALSDNDSDTGAPLQTATVLTTHLPQARTATLLTLTSAARGAMPRGWTLAGSTDDRHWSVLDTRAAERFDWPQQTRAFALAHPGAYAWYRLRFEDLPPGAAVAEIELLAPPATSRTAATGRRTP
jgi:hypothetical protein